MTIKPGKITIVIGQEISTVGLTLQDVAAVREKAFDLMKGMISTHQG